MVPIDKEELMVWLAFFVHFNGLLTFLPVSPVAGAEPLLAWRYHLLRHSAVQYWRQNYVHLISDLVQRIMAFFILNYCNLGFLNQKGNRGEMLATAPDGCSVLTYLFSTGTFILPFHHFLI
jgi:hypothetical protein